MREKWKPVTGFPGYFVSDLGRIVSVCRGSWRFLRGTITPKGYVHVVMRKEGKRYPSFVHVIVLESFVGPRPEGFQCDHINGDPADNRLENLHWVTPVENRRNPVTCKRFSVSIERHCRAVRCLETGEIFSSIKAASDRFKVASTAISGVCHGRKHYHTARGIHFRFVEDAQ